MSTTLQSIRCSPISADELPLTPLQRALLRAGVQILDSDDVKEYQACKLKDARVVPGYDLAFGAVVGAAFGLAIGAFLLVPLLGLIGLALAVPGALLVGCLTFLSRRELPEMLDWRRYSVGYVAFETVCPGSYLAPGIGTIDLPPEAVKIVRRLEDAGARAEVTVEQLDKDPFLFIESLGLPERYCVFAWDEKGFVPR